MRKNQKKYMIGLLTQISKHGKGKKQYLWYIQNHDYYNGYVPHMMLKFNNAFIYFLFQIDRALATTD